VFGLGACVIPVLLFVSSASANDPAAAADAAFIGVPAVEAGGIGEGLQAHGHKRFGSNTQAQV
jgi:hypothetical protein